MKVFLQTFSSNSAFFLKNCVFSFFLFLCFPVVKNYGLRWMNVLFITI